VKEKESALQRQREELQRLTQELQTLETQRLETEQHERDLDAQDPTVYELTDTSLNNEKRIQSYTTALDLIEQEIQQKRQELESLVQQETQLETELNTLETSIKGTQSSHQQCTFNLFNYSLFL
jgi:predicted  nucleic acid-binding Zn-ribbon protein